MITYADSGLRTDLGHHANNARSIVRALKQKCIDDDGYLQNAVRVLGHKQADVSLETDIGEIERVFSHTPYERHNPDPVAGWIHDFNWIGSATADELKQQVGAMGEVKVYWNSAQPPQLLAVLKLLNEVERAKAVVEFGTAPGLDTKIGPDGQIRAAWRDPRADPTGVMWRYCSYLINDSIKPRLTLAAYCKQAAELFAEVMNHPVACLPVPRDAHPHPFLRGNRAPLTIGILGHQRIGDKGYQHVPQIIRLVLDKCRFISRPVKFMIHNGEPGGCGTAQVDRIIKQLALEYPSNVDFNGNLGTTEIWDSLLDRTDLMVCPYWPERFHASWSACCAEALANGIPLVVPLHTSLHTMCHDVGSIPSPFTFWDAGAIADAVFAAIKNFDELAKFALEAVPNWAAKHGGARTAAAIAEALG